MTILPREDPAQLTLRARPSRVTRLNRRTLALLASVGTIVVAVAVMWAFRGPTTSRGSSNREMATADHVTRAEGLSRLPKDYASIPKLGPPLGELGRAQLSAEQAAGIPTLPERENFRPNAEEEALRAERLRLQSENREALKAQVFYQLRQRHDNTTQVSDIHVGTNGSAPPAASPLIDQDPDPQNQKQTFTRNRSDSLIYASGSIQTPRSPYELIAGAVIPAALWTGIDSDLPGEIVANVTENVFDSVTGRILLIPQGSRLIGQYDSHVAFGQRRVLMVWTRLTMPDGSSIVLDRIPATDTEGRAGLEDGVDWHWGRIFSAAAVSTLIGVASELAVPEERTGQGNTVILATRSSLQDTVNQVGQELTRRNLDIQPTLTIRPGFPVRAIVNKDLVLRPYSQP
jgi:type IV secretory pathway VirB10-like protein